MSDAAIRTPALKTEPEVRKDESVFSVPSEANDNENLALSQQPEARMFVFNAGVDLNDIVRAVNQVGAAPGDLVAILEALKESGALRAELIVI